MDEFAGRQVITLSCKLSPVFSQIYVKEEGVVLLTKLWRPSIDVSHIFLKVQKKNNWSKPNKHARTHTHTHKSRYTWDFVRLTGNASQFQFCSLESMPWANIHRSCMKNKYFIIVWSFSSKYNFFFYWQKSTKEYLRGICN